MASADPFAELLAYLDRRGRPFADALSVIERWGAPWDVVARGPIGGTPLWPESWPPAPPRPMSRGVARWRLAWTREPEPTQLLPLLRACHSWLAGRIVEWLLPVFHPFCEEVPPALTRTSPRAVTWTLVVRAVASGRVLAHEAPWLAPHALDRAAAPGDLLALHVAIEDLVSAWASGAATRETAAGPAGGLRTPSFLSAYPRISGARGRALGGLVQRSPLTRFVYADLVSTLRPSAEVDALDPLLEAGRSTRLTEEKRSAWKEIWFAQIARSLLAALLSMPPDVAELRTAERALEDLRRREPYWDVFERWSNTRIVNALERKRRALRDRIATDVAGRFRLAQVLGPDPARPPRQLVRMRLLDMLVRHLVTEWMPELIEQWRPYAGQPTARADQRLFGAHGPRLAAFESALCKLTARELAEILGRQAGAALREDLLALLNPPVLDDADVEGLAAAAGMPRQLVTRLAARLSDRVGAVALPFRYPSETAAPPATLLARWLPPLCAAFPDTAAPAPDTADELV